MDRFDVISAAAAVALLIGSFAVVRDHAVEAKPDRSRQPMAAAADNPLMSGEIDGKGRLIKNLLDAGSLPQAEIIARELVGKYPYEGEPHMLMGDLFMRRQEPLKAMHEYKEAVDLDPDYLDKKTPLFQGKKLKVAVGEALAEVTNRLRLDPGDESLKSERKIIYYLYRKIAGSCG